MKKFRISHMLSHVLRLPALFAFATLGVLAACSSDGENQNKNGDGGAGGEGGDSEAIAVLSRVCTPEDCLSYLNLYPSLDAMSDEGTIDASKSIELPYSQGRVFNGSIYLFSRGEQPEVTRYSVRRDLTLKKHQTVSFANTGTTVFCEICNIFGSEELAFHVDATSGTLVSWDPTEMKIVEVSAIAESITGKLKGGFADFLFPRLIDGKAYYNASWSNSDVPEVLDRAALIRFDVDDPTPKLDVIEDDRCGGTWMMAPFADDKGNVYAMGDYNAGYYQAGVLDPVDKPACLLRIKPGQDEFDPDYYVDLLEVLNAKAVRNAFAMADGKILMSILPKDSQGVSENEIKADPWAYYSIKTFRYVVLDLKTLAVTQVEELGDVAAGSASQLRVDDRALLQIYDADRTASIYEISADGTVNKIIAANSGGDFDMIGRVR
jgi:hypothetical protein